MDAFDRSLEAQLRYLARRAYRVRRRPRRGGRKPITAKLSGQFYEKLGDEVTNELVTWLNAVDDSYRREFRDLFDANVGQVRAEMAQLRAEMRGESQLRAEMRGEMSILRGEMSQLRAEPRADVRASVGVILAARAIWE